MKAFIFSTVLAVSTLSIVAANKNSHNAQAATTAATTTATDDVTDDTTATHEAAGKDSVPQKKMVEIADNEYQSLRERSDKAISLHNEKESLLNCKTRADEQLKLFNRAISIADRYKSLFPTTATAKYDSIIALHRDSLSKIVNVIVNANVNDNDNENNDENANVNDNTTTEIKTISVDEEELIKLKQNSEMLEDLEAEVKKLQVEKPRCEEAERAFSDVDKLLTNIFVLYPLEKQYDANRINGSLQFINEYQEHSSDRFKELSDVYTPMLSDYKKYNDKFIYFLLTETRKALKTSNWSPRSEVVNNHILSPLYKLEYYTYYRNKDKAPYKSIIYLDNVISAFIQQLNKGHMSEEQLKELVVGKLGGKYENPNKKVENGGNGQAQRHEQTAPSTVPPRQKKPTNHNNEPTPTTLE